MQQNLLILIVDDSEFARKTLGIALSGHRYIFAKNGQEAVNIFKEKKPNLVFLDLGLPDIPGVQVLAEFIKLKADSYVVIVSGNDTKETVIECISAGAKGYIVKPFSKFTVEQYIDNYVKSINFDELF